MSAMDHKAKTSKHAAKLAADPRFAGWVASKPGNPAAAPKIYDQAEMDAALEAEAAKLQRKPRVTTAAELRQQAKSDTSCVGAFARARPGRCVR